MAKLLSSTVWDLGGNRQKRYFVIGLNGHRIKILDILRSEEHTVKADSAEELAEMMNFTDDEWHAWMNNAGVGVYTGLPRSEG